MNLYTQQNTTEEQILDNYVFLKEVILGEKRLVVKKQLKKNLAVKRCILCLNEFQPRSYSVKYCGSQRNRTGCVMKMLSVAGKLGGKKVQIINKYNKLKRLWEEDE